jgi:hypothetical protein
MSVRSFVTAFVVALILEAGAFAYYYGDLLYLRQPAETLATDSAATFARHATEALERRRLTRQHLETIASTAQRFNLPAIELRALRRRSELDSLDTSLRLRLADALRRSEHFDEAEHIYLEVLEASSPRERR